MKDRYGRETVPCKWCGKPTPMTGTNLCDRCWQLDWRIHNDPELAKRILDFYTKSTPQTEGVTP